jgi:hypothetical protein
MREETPMIDRALLKALRIDINAALAAVGEKHGVVLSAGNASFERDGSTGNYKLEVATITDSGVVMTKEASDFKFNALKFHMKSTDLGEEFVATDGQKFVLMGAKPRSKTATLLAKKVVDGVMYKLPLMAFPNAHCVGYR